MVVFIKLVFIVNLLCSYAICIYPTNTIVEGWIFGKRQSKTVFWLKNISRCLVVLAAAYLGVALASKIDKFLGLMGAVLCAPLALTIPSLIDLKVRANTFS